jgi:ubiquinone/menaquinone biosynthesis C-methylase UbiE
MGCAAAPGRAAEQAKPEDINAKFRNPDVAKSIETFEGESREIFQKRAEILAACDLRTGMHVADVGAGTGLFTRLFAPRVAPGKVYAVDISRKFIEHIEKTCQAQKLDNVVGIVCGDESTDLPPNSVDLVFVCDTYHHFPHPEKNLASIRQALRPGARLVVVDFEKEKGITPDWVMTHVRADRETAIREITSAGFKLLDQAPETMKGQYVLRFEKT